MRPAERCKKPCLAGALVAVLALGPAPPALSVEPAPGVVADPGALCEEAVALAERAEQIPRHLLAAIAGAESGRPVTTDRVGGPWPWTVNTQGQGLFFDSKTAAMEAVDALLARGVRNIDVGCVQINLGFHPDAFLDLEEAFDPLANAAYGAAYLKALFMQTGSWPEAVGRYHSTTHSRNTAYRDKVLDLWNRGRGGAVLQTNDAQQARTQAAQRSAVAAPQPLRRAGEAQPGEGPISPGLSGDAIDEIRSRLGALAPK